MRGEGVDVNLIEFDPERPMGIYFVQWDYPLSGIGDVVYYRRGFAVPALRILMRNT